jgi:hypothetical protein
MRRSRRLATGLPVVSQHPWMRPDFGAEFRFGDVAPADSGCNLTPFTRDLRTLNQVGVSHGSGVPGLNRDFRVSHPQGVFCTRQLKEWLLRSALLDSRPSAPGSAGNPSAIRFDA